MPIRFEAYRMRDGVTPLSQDYFNPVFGDLDARIADMEARRANLQEVIDELTRFGLQRIDTLLGPSMAEVNDTLQYLYQKRAELEAAIGDIGQLVTTGALNTALAVEQTARQQAIAAEQTARQQAIATATAPTGAMSVTYNAGRVSTITEDGVTTTITYDGAGRVSTISWPRNGKTRTETYSYNGAGQVTGMNATEA